MCLILLGYKTSKTLPLVLAANRDEFLTRPAAPMDFWKESPAVLAGKDLEQGGTWLGVHTRGRFAALTNFRDPRSIQPKAPSRGRIITRFLESRDPARGFLEDLDKESHIYNGFNLLAGQILSTTIDLCWYSNRTRKILRIPPGIHGLSNHLLDTEWPKVARGKAMMKKVLGAGSRGKELEEDLFSLLSDRTRPPDSALPDTGVGLEWERILSPVFIKSPEYGTRVSTLIIFDRDGKIRVSERSHDNSKQKDRRFCIESPKALART